VTSLKQLLEDMIQRKASDLHITAGVPPEYRIDGSITPSEYEILTPDLTANLAYPLMVLLSAPATFVLTRELRRWTSA